METANYEDSVGHSLKILNGALALWMEHVLTEAGVQDPEQWCFDQRHELREGRFLVDLDTTGLLDIFLAGWDSQFEKCFNNRDPRGLAFDIKRHRNKWAHQSVFSAREAYRALDSITQMLTMMSAKRHELRHEAHKVNLLLEDVVVDMAQLILQRRRAVPDAPLDVDGDVEMAGLSDDGD